MNTKRCIARTAAAVARGTMIALFIALLCPAARPESATLRRLYVSPEGVEIAFPGANRFSMKVNLCSGYGVLRGTYSVYPSGHAIKCTVIDQDFRGFDADRVRDFDFEENDNFNKLIYRGEPIGCGPSPAILFDGR